MVNNQDVFRVLKETSRTFLLPIMRLPPLLQEAISAAYLCMRALDEIEDHTSLDNGQKSAILRDIRSHLQANIAVGEVSPELQSRVFSEYRQILPEVSLRLGDWLAHAPGGISLRIWEATASMADRMASWADRNWQINNEADLNEYTYSVAGAVGLLICDIWTWFDGSQLDRECAVHFGRGLQSVNILRNRKEDLQRGVDFYPPGWEQKDLIAYARRNISRTRTELKPIPQQAFSHLIEIPLSLAEATLDAIERGAVKVSRQQVMQIMAQFGLPIQ
jgi:farnesyl-diphosphate farnesyltransferase